jgi:hypothetical protein
MDFGFRVFRAGDEFTDFALHYRHLMAAALEMFVVEDTAPDDRKIAIAPDEEMRELIDESEEFAQDPRADFHRDVLLIEANAMMGIVDVRRILEIPALVIEGEGTKRMFSRGALLSLPAKPRFSWQSKHFG